MKTKFSVLVLLIMLSTSAINAQEPFIGEIRMFAGNFAPGGWAFCDGQLLSISQNSALFSLLGTIYGGDGRTSFALPDLRGRVPIHAGHGKGISNVRVGQKGGAEMQRLGKANLLKDASGKTFEANTVLSSYPEVYSRDPYLGVNYIIALVGIYPSRS